MKQLLLLLSTLSFCTNFIFAADNQSSIFLCKATKGNHTFYVYGALPYHTKAYEVPPAVKRLLQANKTKLFFLEDYDDPNHSAMQKFCLERIGASCRGTSTLLPHVKKLYQAISSLPARAQNFVPYSQAHFIASLLSKGKTVYFPYETLYMQAKKHRVEIGALGKWYEDTSLEVKEIMSKGAEGVYTFSWAFLPDILPFKGLYLWKNREAGIKKQVEVAEELFAQYEANQVSRFLAAEENEEEIVDIYNRMVRAVLQGWQKNKSTCIFIIEPWLLFGEYGLLNCLKRYNYQLEFLPYS